MGCDSRASRRSRWDSGAENRPHLISFFSRTICCQLLEKLQVFVLGTMAALVLLWLLYAVVRSRESGRDWIGRLIAVFWGHFDRRWILESKKSWTKKVDVLPRSRRLISRIQSHNEIQRRVRYPSQSWIEREWMESWEKHFWTPI